MKFFDWFPFAIELFLNLIEFTALIVSGLWLIVVQFNDGESTCDGKRTLKVIYDYMKYSMGVENPEENNEYIQMKEEIQDRQINLTKIV